MRWIYFSPHLDDAALSCGGWIHEQVLSKQKVEIWTICAGDPPDGDLSPLAQKLHADWGTVLDTPALRRAEDVAACRILGVRYRHLPFQDCIYRLAADGSWLYPMDESISGEVSPQDIPTILTLQTFLAASLKPDDILVGPLTLGHHVDHQMVRQAIEGLGRPLLYFADIPYLFNQPTQLAELITCFQSQVYPFSTQALNVWQASIEAYTSQVGVLFKELGNPGDVLHTYYQKDHGIRLWKAVEQSS
jgi:LmbE family N-acetylglucosaminyl deacetylase